MIKKNSINIQYKYETLKYELKNSIDLSLQILPQSKNTYVLRKLE